MSFDESNPLFQFFQNATNQINSRIERLCEKHDVSTSEIIHTVKSESNALIDHISNLFEKYLEQVIFNIKSLREEIIRSSKNSEEAIERLSDVTLHQIKEVMLRLKEKDIGEANVYLERFSETNYGRIITSYPRNRKRYLRLVKSFI